MMSYKQKWEVVHWPQGGRLQLCETKEVAEKLVSNSIKPAGITNHIVREIWFDAENGNHVGRKKPK